MRAEVKKHLPSFSGLTPLGVSFPLLPGSATVPAAPPVEVRALRQPGKSCMRCTARWPQQQPDFKVLVLKPGSVVVEGKRRFAEQGPPATNFSGCRTTGVIGDLKDVRRLVHPSSGLKTRFAELEHWLDWQRTFSLTGERMIATVRRLTPARSHLRGRSLQECRFKVNLFLGNNNQVLAPDVLSKYGLVFSVNAKETYEQSVKERDTSSAHTAVAFPSPPRPPVAPNIDRRKNPFGCAAFFRVINRRSAPGVPGKTSRNAIRDLQLPLKAPWHRR